MIIDKSKELLDRFDDLGPGDMFIGRVISRHMKLTILIDLLERGVHCFPSPLSQLLNSSKSAQALILGKWMKPNSLVIRRRSDLLDAVSEYNHIGIGPVITKEDRMHCGHGIRQWDSVENVYSYTAFDESSYPFVLQPKLSDFVDVRVIIVGDYKEAYQRENPSNFRKNLSAGGCSRPYEIDENLKKMCGKVMERGKFPYAHIDVHITENNNIFLSEIALNGGLKGAKISQKELKIKKETVAENFIENKL